MSLLVSVGRSPRSLHEWTILIVNCGEAATYADHSLLPVARVKADWLIPTPTAAIRRPTGPRFSVSIIVRREVTISRPSHRSCARSHWNVRWTVPIVSR